jgi:uncharacterized protein YrrD
MFGKVGKSLRTFTLLNRLYVVSLQTGEVVGEICDIGIDSNGRVKGLIVKRKNRIFPKSYWLPLTNVQQFGHDCIFIKSENELLEGKYAENLYTIKHDESLYGKELLTTEGEHLGMLQDVYFLENLGTIVAYEITEGLFTDLREGPQVISSSNPPKIGKDAVIIT